MIKMDWSSTMLVAIPLPCFFAQKLQKGDLVWVFQWLSHCDRLPPSNHINMRWKTCQNHVHFIMNKIPISSRFLTPSMFLLRTSCPWLAMTKSMASNGWSDQQPSGHAHLHGGPGASRVQGMRDVGDVHSFDKVNAPWLEHPPHW